MPKLQSNPADEINSLLSGIPYAMYLGIEADLKGDELTTILQFRERNIGNPLLPALHGGVVAGFLETTAMMQLALQMRSDYLPKPVDITIDYMRSGKPIDAYARASITRLGRRVASVHAEAWQDSRDRPIAAIHGNFLIRPKEESA